MLSKIAVASVFAAGVMAQYGAPEVTETVAPPVGDGVVEYYYGDYDNLVYTGQESVYYQSALTQEAIDREGTAANVKASTWGAVQEVNVQDVYNLKGATFCGEQDPAAEVEGSKNWGGKYKQLFVADAGDDDNAGSVIGWQVAEDPKDPAKLQLSGKWQVYGQPESKVTDVECGPNNGIFIADQGYDSVYWVTKDNLVAKNENPDYQTVIPADCKAAVADVRSLSWNAESGKLTWSNNVAEDTTVPIENAGVFQYGAPAGSSPVAAQCNAEMCDAWSKECAKKIDKVADAAAGEQVWAVAQGWDKVQVSKGDANLYDAKADKEIAALPEQATYAEAPADPARNVVFVSDEKEGAVYSVTQSGQVNKVADVADPYGVAYNNGYGWAAGEDSASMVTLAAGALMAALAMML